jgi:hypothetical protein
MNFRNDAHVLVQPTAWNTPMIAGKHQCVDIKPVQKVMQTIRRERSGVKAGEAFHCDYLRSDTEVALELGAKSGAMDLENPRVTLRSRETA